MKFFSRNRKAREPQVHIGDPRFDGWETVEDYEDLATATAFAGRLTELGIPNALTADWQLDSHGRGEIYLQVPGEHYDEATVAVSGYDL
jgi:hypothetical protein